MLNTPLQLERSFFTAVDVEAIPEHKRGTVSVDVTTEPFLGVRSPDASRWQAELDIVVAGREGEPPPPYRVHLHTIGFFSFKDQESSEIEKARMLGVTGISILYSQAREYLLMLTARGPWGPFQLPTVSFLDSSPRKQETVVPKVSELGADYAPEKPLRKAKAPSTSRPRDRAPAKKELARKR